MLKGFRNKEDNVVHVVQQYVNTLKLRVSPNTIKKTLHDHPNYPSLLSIADTLREWNIGTQALIVAKSNLKKNVFTFPFFAHLIDKRETFVLIHSISGDEVVFSDENNSKEIYKMETFLRLWSGVVLQTTPETFSGARKYFWEEIGILLEKSKSFIYLILLALSIFLIIDTYQTKLIPILLLKMVGSILGVLLVSQTYLGENGIGKNICKLIKKNDCNGILKSKAGKVFEWLTWGEVGLYYFLGSLTALLFNSDLLPVIAIFNFLAVPFTIYSFSYQYKVRSWCVLCCCVQLVLLAEFYYFLKTFELHVLHITIIEIATITASFAIPIIIWLTVKTIYSRTLKLKNTASKLKKLKFNHGIFDFLMLNQPYFEIKEEVGALTIGNKFAENVITFVSSPFCPPCASAHGILDSILKYNNNVMIKLVFVSDDRDDDERTKMVRHLYAIYEEKGAVAAHEAVTNWFACDTKSFAKWSVKHPSKVLENQFEVTKRHNEWCDSVNIQFTPTLFLNGRELPEIFNVGDLKYLIN